MVIDFNMAGFAGSPFALRCALAAIKAERMIFATDYPQNFNHSDPEPAKISTALAPPAKRSIICRWIKR